MVFFFNLLQQLLRRLVKLSAATSLSVPLTQMLSALDSRDLQQDIIHKRYLEVKMTSFQFNSILLNGHRFKASIQNIRRTENYGMSITCLSDLFIVTITITIITTDTFKLMYSYALCSGTSGKHLSQLQTDLEQERRTFCRHLY